jgi:hypothetical protein
MLREESVAAATDSIFVQLLGKPGRMRLRVRFVHGKIVGNGCPCHLRLGPNMHRRLRHAAIIDRAQRNTSILRYTGGFVPKWRSASAAKHPKPAAGIVLGDTRLRRDNSQLGRLNQAPSRVSGAGEFSTVRTVAVPGLMNGPIDLERDRSAETTSLHNCHTNPIVAIKLKIVRVA